MRNGTVSSLAVFIFNTVSQSLSETLPVRENHSAAPGEYYLIVSRMLSCPRLQCSVGIPMVGRDQNFLNINKKKSK